MFSYRRAKTNATPRTWQICCAWIDAEHGAVEPGQRWPGVRAAQHRDLVTQHEDLDVLGRVGASEERQPAQHASQHQVGESEGHSGRSCLAGSGR
jgi:hypothetical protein